MNKIKQEKREEILGVIALIVGIIIFIFIIGKVGYWELHYTMECKVIEINNNIVILEDTKGYLWEFENNSLEIGETYTVTFFNNDTYTRNDDKIEKLNNKH